ncbi:MAG: TonB family protein [Pseudomonadota bacterium]
MLSDAAKSNDRFMLCALVAGALHIFLIIGISFDTFRTQGSKQQVEVTLVQKPSHRPQDARHIAQANQQGNGERALRDLSSGLESTLPQAESSTRQDYAVDNDGRARLSATTLTTNDADQKIVDRSGEQANYRDLPEAERRLAQLQQELAQLNANLGEQQRRYSNEPRVRRLDAVSARAAVDAAYLADWRRRVEAVGNRYYPEASLRYGIYGSLKMLVTIRADGQLDAIDILSSSGHAVLDEAAVRIVRMAAPFLPFPDELRATTDKLEILRTWQFEQNPLSS